MTQGKLLPLIAAALLAPGLLAGERPPQDPVRIAEDLPADLSAQRVRMRADSRPATPDLLATVWRCPRCRQLNAAQRLIPEQPPFDTAADLLALMERAGLGRGGVWPPPAAAQCDICAVRFRKDFRLKPLEVIFFRYLPESGCDAVARAKVDKGRLTEVGWGVLEVAGGHRRVGRLADQRGFSAAFGRALSVRAAWSEIVRACIRKDEPQAVKVGPGYFLTCRPRSADAGKDGRLAAATAAALT
ncbi:MAG: hypothetical protein ACYTGB_17030, partial [Planctomycetota bacterium]